MLQKAKCSEVGKFTFWLVNFLIQTDFGSFNYDKLQEVTVLRCIDFKWLSWTPNSCNSLSVIKIEGNTSVPHCCFWERKYLKQKIIILSYALDLLMYGNMEFKAEVFGLLGALPPFNPICQIAHYKWLKVDRRTLSVSYLWHKNCYKSCCKMDSFQQNRNSAISLWIPASLRSSCAEVVAITGWLVAPRGQLITAEW